MKTGQIFWGIFFVVIGSLILLTKYDLLACDWDFIWDLWPLILIFIGLLVVSRKTIAKPVVSLLFGILVGVLVFGFFYSIFNLAYYYDDCDYDYDNDYSTSEIFTEDYDGSRYAKLEVEAAAGTFSLKETTDLLVKGTTHGSYADYNFYTYSRGNTANIQFDLGRTNFSIFHRNIRNSLDVELNDNPIWDMRLDIGAARAKLDLTPFKVREVELNTGATQVYMKLGKRYDKTTLNVEMGAASLKIAIPKSSGCKLTGKMILMSKNIPGFVKKSKRYYVTPNYENADNKIEIDIQGGISSLEIDRY
ncbi:LiaI-LiaF-like domain-containing protein [Bacteroidota bacterium]